EHPPVVTLGRQVEVARRSLRASPEELAERGFDLEETDRGGNVTVHGPGQLVCYPIIKLSDFNLTVGAYVKRLQTVVIDAIARCSLHGQLDPSAVGVWVKDPRIDTTAKICAIGVRVKRGVTMHGLALNVNIDLSLFDVIVPCGLEGRPVTSMRRMLGPAGPNMDHVKWLMKQSITNTFESNPAVPLV
ncbi:MAG TPA: lipoyl(octanoyl) transferase LipB, partial [Tepidisphaeraceae bacterium]|nr:lipoyl(octanoyl) transferase LipB [Tepidisphaeraceae bacterium]